MKCRLRNFFVALATFAVISACSVENKAAEIDVSKIAATSSDEVLKPAESGTPKFTTLRLEPLVDFSDSVDIATRVKDQSLYIVSRKGLIAQFKAGVLRTVLNMSDMTSGDGEQGLLGLAFSNDGNTAYLNYTNKDGDTVIASIGVRVDGEFILNTISTLFVIKQPYSNHNGGDIVVEPSGSLLIATGDGGSADDPLRVALDESSMLGKVLRLDSKSGATTMIAKGLRNPWRIDLHDNRLWLADVGQNKWEEVNVIDNVAGAPGIISFGWSAFEANSSFNSDQPTAEHQLPMLAYEHGDDGCSISGGAVAVAGPLRNRFVFADYCSGKVWSFAINDSAPMKEILFDEVDSPVAVVRAFDDVYVLSLSGTIWRIVG